MDRDENRRPTMKTKPTARTIRSLIILMAVAILFSFSLPVSAGGVKRTGKQNEQTWKNRDDSGAMIVPKPVADDSPINPVSGNERDRPKKGNDRDQKKKSRR
jgi:hypothetical protein